MKYNRILYITQAGNFTTVGSGVDKKIFSKIKFLNADCFQCDCISFRYDIENETRINEHIKLIPVKYTYKRKYFNSFHENRNFYATVKNYLQQHAARYDFILFRYPGATYGLIDLVKSFKGKVAFEHNTKESVEVIIEVKPNRRTIPFSIKPGYFLYLFEIGYYRIIAEKILSGKVFKNAAFGISVTKELAEYENKRCNSYKNYIVSNGVEVESNALRTPPLFDGKSIHLFMLVGFKASWHGIARLVNSMKHYQGNSTIQIDIIGEVTEDDKELVSLANLQNNIRFLPSMSSGQLDHQLNIYHAGLGTLALYKKNMHEASPLKVREYISRGFPVIYAYDDTDLSADDRFSNYCLEFPNNDSVIDFSTIIQFLGRVCSDQQHHLKIRQLAVQTIDMKVKMEQIINICRSH